MSASLPLVQDAYYKSYITPLNAVVNVQYISPQKGKGLFAGRDFKKDEIILKENPLINMQHVANRGTASCCPQCCCFLGNLWEQIQHHLNLLQLHSIKIDKKFIQQVQKEFDQQVGTTRQTKPATCPGGCGEVFCSEKCRDAYYNKHHKLLCVGPVHDVHPLVLFKHYSIANNELLLLAGQVVAMILCEWINQMQTINQSTIQNFVELNVLESVSIPFSVYEKKPWWIVRQDEGVEEDTMKQTLAESHGLLTAALRPIVENFKNQQEQYLKQSNQLSDQLLQLLSKQYQSLNQLFDLEFWANLMGLFEMNNNSIEIPSPLQILLQKMENLSSGPKSALWKQLHPLIEGIIQEQDQELIAAHLEEEHDENDNQNDTMATDMISSEPLSPDSEEGLQQALSRDFIFPPYEGLGLFPLAAVMNHSCDPNCIVKFDDGDNTACVYALRDIKAGEELEHSYIEESDPIEERTENLRSYGFVCQCPKCQTDRAAQQ